MARRDTSGYRERDHCRAGRLPSSNRRAETNDFGSADGTSIDRAGIQSRYRRPGTLIKVNNAPAQVPSYPENVDEPRIQASSFSNNAFIYYAVQPLDGNPKGVDIVTRRDFVEDHVQTALERVPGVSEARIGGGANRQVRIYVNPSKLAKRQITVGRLRQALRQRNVDVSGGDIDSGKRRYLLRTLGRFESIDAIELVRRNLVLGSLSACGVLYLFLRSVSTTLLGAIGIPICTIAAFLGLLLMGRTINVISLAGIAFAIGMTLDNTIVVLENIHRHRFKGKG